MTRPHQSQDRKSIWNAVYWQCKSSSLSSHSGGSVLTIVVSGSIVCSCVSSCCGLLSGIIAVIPIRSLIVLTIVTSLVAIVISYVGKKYDHDNRHYSSIPRHRHQPTHLPVAFSRVKVWLMWSWFNSKAYTTWYTGRTVAYPVLTRVASFPTSTSVLARFCCLSVSHVWGNSPVLFTALLATEAGEGWGSRLRNVTNQSVSCYQLNRPRKPKDWWCLEQDWSCLCLLWLPNWD